MDTKNFTQTWFEPILNEIKIPGDNIFMKKGRIILSEKLQMKATTLAHKWSVTAYLQWIQYQTNLLNVWNSISYHQEIGTIM